MINYLAVSYLSNKCILLFTTLITSCASLALIKKEKKKGTCTAPTRKGDYFGVRIL